MTDASLGEFELSEDDVTSCSWETDELQTVKRTAEVGPESNISLTSALLTFLPGVPSTHTPDADNKENDGVQKCNHLY